MLKARNKSVLIIISLIYLINLNCVSKQLEANSNKIIEEQAIVFNDCAPWDGPAVSIYISKLKQNCEEINIPNITLHIYMDKSKIVGKEIKLPNQQLGNIIKQNRKEEFVQIKTGFIYIETADENNEIVGHYEAEFENGEKIKSRFRAKWCKRIALCG